MAQNYTADVFGALHVGQTDLQNMENNFGVLRSNFSGTTQPVNPVAGMMWADTGKGVNKVRNNANSAWYAVMHGDVYQRLWVYRNSAMAGWVVNATVSDRVLAIKGGSVYTTGGATAGGWNISGLSTTSAHTHSSGTLYGVDHSHTISRVSYSDIRTQGSPIGNLYTGSSPVTIGGSTASAGGNHTHSGNGTWRPAASVGTLQYTNV